MKRYKSRRSGFGVVGRDTRKRAREGWWRLREGEQQRFVRCRPSLPLSVAHSIPLALCFHSSRGGGCCWCQWRQAFGVDLEIMLKVGRRSSRALGSASGPARRLRIGFRRVLPLSPGVIVGGVSRLSKHFLCIGTKHRSSYDRH